MVKRLLRPFVLVIEVLLLAWAVLFLSEYFGWSFVREAGPSTSLRASGVATSARNGRTAL
jgi:hypothetical protein